MYAAAAGGQARRGFAKSGAKPLPVAADRRRTTRAHVLGGAEDIGTDFHADIFAWLEPHRTGMTTRWRTRYRRPFLARPREGCRSARRSAASTASRLGQRAHLRPRRRMRCGWVPWLHAIVHMAKPAEGNSRCWYWAADRPFSGIDMDALASGMAKFEGRVRV